MDSRLRSCYTFLLSESTTRNNQARIPLDGRREEYGQMEHALMEMYGEGANLKVFVKLLIGAVAAKQKIEAAGGKIEKMIILTNKTADEWEAYKKLREKCEEEKKHGT